MRQKRVGQHALPVFLERQLEGGPDGVAQVVGRLPAALVHVARRDGRQRVVGDEGKVVLLRGGHGRKRHGFDGHVFDNCLRWNDKFRVVLK